MFNGESDLNTNIVFTIPWARAFELTRGKTDFSFLSFEYPNTLIQGIPWSDYDTNQYNPSSSILLWHFESRAESIACIFSFQTLSQSSFRDKRRKARHKDTKTFAIIADHTFGKIKEDTCRETKICQNLLQNTPFPFKNSESSIFL